MQGFWSSHSPLLILVAEVLHLVGFVAGALSGPSLDVTLCNKNQSKKGRVQRGGCGTLPGASQGGRTLFTDDRGHDDGRPRHGVAREKSPAGEDHLAWQHVLLFAKVRGKKKLGAVCMLECTPASQKGMKTKKNSSQSARQLGLGV